MKKTLKKVLSIIPYLLLLISFILIIQVATSMRKGETPTLFGKAIFFVVSPSMEDTIIAGDIIFVNTNVDKYNVGDIITFRQPTDTNIIITHRIIEIDIIYGVSYYTTLGDNNYESLDWEIDFTEDYIIGKYSSKSGFIGSIYQSVFSNGLNVIFIGIVLVFIVIGGMEVFNIINTLKQAKEKIVLEEKEKLIQEELEKLRKQKENRKE
ncbi:MAG: signal peptidase I [Tenericutes bacterium]|nr:signal peptidase I [Mycoplasmatota bacterium]